MATKRVGHAGLAAGLGMMAAAAGLGGAMTGPPVRMPEVEPDLPKLNRFGKRRGFDPKPSKPMSETYRANVRAQRGFTTRRLEELRLAWRADCALNRKQRKPELVWAEFLDAHRNTQLEKQFAA